jgi:hypothetical protein
VPVLTNRTNIAIPQPAADFESLILTSQALAQAVEILGGARGDPLVRAVTFLDLIDLGLVSTLTVEGMRSDWRGARVDFASRREIEELRARLEKLEKA